MARWAWVVMVAMVATGGWVPMAEAHGEEEVGALQAGVTLDERGTQVERPTGWEVAEPPEGARALFRSASDSVAQMEVRVSEDISRGGWERFWRAFDTDLRRHGFEVVMGRSTESYGGRQGLAFEYEIAVGEEGARRLVVWHVHHEGEAWVFTGFFDESRRDAFGRNFDELLESVDWQ